MTSRTNLGFVDDDGAPSSKTFKKYHDSAQQTPAVSNGPTHIQEKSTFRAYVSVSILCLINLINYMDRYTIAGVLDQVQKYYNLNNEEAGLLQTSFVVSYMVMAPIFGYLGDRYNRKLLMCCGVLFWSITTYLGSIIPENYFGIFITLRMLVGTGEASYSTIAPTIIADLFTKDRRSQMLALFYFAIPVGSGLGYIAGSKVAMATNQWQWSLRITPIIGLFSVVVCYFFLREPPRGENEGCAQLNSTPFTSDMKDLIKIKSYVWTTLGFTCVTFATGALAWWAPKYMQLAAEVGTDDSEVLGSDTSWIFGIITVFAGILGVVIGSSVSQWYRRINPRADPLICAYGLLACVPLCYAGIVIANKHNTLSWILIALGEVCLCMNWTLVADMLLYVIIPTRRALAQSFQILISHAFGDAISPYICGVIADVIIKDPNSKFENFIGHQYSLYIPVFGLVLGGLFFLMAAFYIESDKNKCSLAMNGDESERLWCRENSISEPNRGPADAVNWPHTPHSYLV